VAGIPSREPWFALPLGEWLGEGRAEPEALAVCRPPACAPGLAVAVLHLSGPDAEAAARVLGRPEPLARALAAPRDKLPKGKAPVAMVASVTPFVAEGARGFTLALSRRDGSRPAFGAALGRPFGPDIKVVLVIGEDAAAVEDAARRAARENLGRAEARSNGSARPSRIERESPEGSGVVSRGLSL
jgi:hypothetical protein